MPKPINGNSLLFLHLLHRILFIKSFPDCISMVECLSSMNKALGSWSNHCYPLSHLTSVPRKFRCSHVICHRILLYSPGQLWTLISPAVSSQNTRIISLWQHIWIFILLCFFSSQYILSSETIFMLSRFTLNSWAQTTMCSNFEIYHTYKCGHHPV